MKEKAAPFLGIFLLIVCGRVYSQPSFEQQRFDRLTAEYGTVAYSAWLSVMHGISNGLPQEINDLYDVTQFPLELALQFTDNQKDKIKQGVIEYLNLQSNLRKTLLFRRAEFWMLAWHQWNICTKLTSVEETVATFYEMDPNHPMFEYVIKNRNFSKDEITGASLATSMSSAELSDLEYRLLVEWSVSSRGEILNTFEQLLTKLKH